MKSPTRKSSLRSGNFEQVQHRYSLNYLRIKASLANLENRVKQWRKKLQKAATGISIQCTTQVATGKGCGKWFKIKSLTYIQTHWYVPPYGCTGGDYWNQGEGQWQCPNCGHINRLYMSPEITELRSQFKGVTNTYDR